MSLLGLAAGQQAAGQDIAVPTREQVVAPVTRDIAAPQTRLTIDGQMERSACALDNPAYADVKVTLASVRFSGAEGAPEVALEESARAYYGRELPVSVLCDIRAAAAAQLQRAGYLAAVEIPAQRLSGGDAEMRVVLGRVTALRVRGEAGPSEALVARYLEPLTKGEVFNSRRAERYLLLADDLPGLDVRLSLRPAADGRPGDLVGEIAVLRRRGAVDFNLQNYGSHALGRWGATLHGEVYDLTGLGDRTALALYSTLDFEEQQTIQLAHDFAVGGSGLRLGGQATYSWTHPSVGIAGFDVRSRTLFATVNALYPIKRTRSLSHSLALGLDYVDQDVDINDARQARDRVRTAFLRLDSAYADADSIAGTSGYNAFEPRLGARASVELRQGLGILGSAPDCRRTLATCLIPGNAPSRIEADPTPTLLRVEGRADWRPIPAWTLSLGARGQVTDSPLPAFEEFSAGNYSIGRGYDPGAITGDIGYAISGEIAYGSLIPKAPDAPAIQPYLFTDVAWSWERDPSRRRFGRDELWSVGGGVRVLYAGMRADMTLAVPLERPDFAPRRGDVRFLVSISTRLLPWSF